MRVDGALQLARAPVAPSPGSLAAARWSSQAALLDGRASGLWSAAQYAEEVASPRAELLGVWSGRELVALACTSAVADETSLLNLVVAPSLRRRGLARALLCCSMWAAARRGHALYTLEVRESNAAATALYTRCGLAQVGRRKGYYQRPREDALLFSLERVAERRDELERLADGLPPGGARELAAIVWSRDRFR